MNITIGLKNKILHTVSSHDTALSVKSGSLPVLATPIMCALMEQAASELVEQFTDENTTSVGTALSIEHLAASPVGAEITAVAEVTAVDGRKIDFAVSAYDNAGLIGKGTHSRFTVYSDRFTQKAKQRIEANCH